MANPITQKYKANGPIYVTNIAGTKITVHTMMKVFMYAEIVGNEGGEAR
jgi:hypothetical protein